MHWALAVIALTLLAFATISGRITGTPITAPMIFTAVGLLFGAEALGLIDLSPSSETVKLLAEATLATVLFADASRIDVRVLRSEVSVPARLLGIGLPLTLLVGFVLALVVFPELLWAEALLLAVILAPTDAALGQAVVTLTRLPSRVRQGLNVESGLNDGICVPLFWIVLAIAQAESGAIGDGAAVRLVLEQIGYGILAGVLAGVLAAGIVVVAAGRGLVDHSWLQIVPLAAAGLAFGIADPIGGSGFIAAFVGGFVFGALRRRSGGEVANLIEEVGEVFGAVTFIVFGAVLARAGARRRDVVGRAVRRPQPDDRPHAPRRGRDDRNRRTQADRGLLGLVRAARARVDRLRGAGDRGGWSTARRLDPHHDLRCDRAVGARSRLDGGAPGQPLRHLVRVASAGRAAEPRGLGGARTFAGDAPASGAASRPRASVSKVTIAQTDAGGGETSQRVFGKL